MIRAVLFCSLAFFLFTAVQDAAAQDAAVQDAAAQDAAAQDASLSAAAVEIAETADAGELAGHNAWMLVCTALVLFMTAPGLAMFYGGLVRKKNVLSILMQCIFLMGLMTVLWALYGYSLAFGSGNAFIGNFDHVFMRGVARYWNEAAGRPETPMSGSIPTLTFMLFQGMFFIITPALMVGAFAERMKFSSMVWFSIFWGTFIYCPLAHMVWGGGFLAYGGEESLLGGALDFAGGTVVHLSSGISALVAALMIGPRMGFGREPLQPHNLTYTALGAAMLWVGWFGFNAGSQLASDGLTSSAFCTTHFAAAAGAVAWALTERLLNGKATVLGASSGAVAGLVCITPAAGFVGPMAALVMGAAAGVACYWSCAWLKHKCGYDDALDAFGVHGIGGALGAVLTGVFATRAVNDMNGGNPLGGIDGNWELVVAQIAALAVTFVFAGVGSAVLLKIIDMTIGLRVTADEERRGLDVSEHGEESYVFM